MYCPKCGKEIADNSVKYCSRCGASLREDRTRKKIYPFILITVICLAALGIVIWQFTVVREKPFSDLSAAESRTENRQEESSGAELETGSDDAGPESASGPSLTATPAPESSSAPAVTDQPQGRDDSASDPAETVQPQSSSDSAGPLSAEEIEKEIQEIRDIYYEIQYHPDQLAAEDAGAGLIRYRDAAGNIVKISAPKGAYTEPPLNEYSAEYYYAENAGTGAMTPRFVFVFGNGEEYRIYLTEDFRCVRYIGPDGAAVDYPEPEDSLELVTEMAEFCYRAQTELHLAAGSSPALSEQEVYDRLTAHYSQGTEDADGSELAVMEGSSNGTVYQTSVRCGMPGNPSASQMLYEVQVNMETGEVTQTRVLTDNKVTTFNIR